MKHMNLYIKLTSIEPPHKTFTYTFFSIHRHVQSPIRTHCDAGSSSHQPTTSSYSTDIHQSHTNATAPGLVMVPHHHLVRGLLRRPPLLYWPCTSRNGSKSAAPISWPCISGNGSESAGSISWSESGDGPKSAASRSVSASKNGAKSQPTQEWAPQDGASIRKP